MSYSSGIGVADSSTPLKTQKKTTRIVALLRGCINGFTNSSSNPQKIGRSSYPADHSKEEAGFKAIITNVSRTESGQQNEVIFAPENERRTRILSQQQSTVSVTTRPAASVEAAIGVTEAAVSIKVHQASEEILRTLERYALAKTRWRFGNHYKNLQSYFKEPEEKEHRSDNKITARQELAKIFVIARDNGQVTVSYREGKRPDTVEQFNKILRYFNFIDKGTCLSANLEQTFSNHPDLQKTPLIQQKIASRNERYRRAVNDARYEGIKSKSGDDYGELKKKFRAEYLNQRLHPSFSNSWPALQKFTDNVLKEQAVYDRGKNNVALTGDQFQIKSGEFSLKGTVLAAFGLADSQTQGKNYLKEINNAGKRYKNRLSDCLGTLTAPDKAIDTIVRAAQKAEFEAGKHFNKNYAKNNLEATDNPFQSAARWEDITLSVQDKKTIENKTYRVTKDIIVKTAQEFDNHLAAHLEEGIRNFNLGDAIKAVKGTDKFQINNSDPFIKWHNTFSRALNEHQYIQTKLAAEVKSVSEALLPGEKNQQLRKEIQDEFSATQLVNRQNLRKHNHQRLTDIRTEMFAGDVKILFDEAKARTDLKDKLIAATPQVIKELLKIEGSSLVANERIQEAMNQYRNNVAAVGKAIVQESIQTARAERQEARDANDVTSLRFHQTNQDIIAEALQLAANFLNDLPHMKSVAEKNKAALIEVPGLLKSLFKPFNSFIGALKNGSALFSIGIGITAVVAPALFGGALAAIGTILTGPIIPLIGITAIVIGAFLLIPSYINIFSERTKMQKINTSTKKLIKQADEIQKGMLNDIKSHITTYANAVLVT